MKVLLVGNYPFDGSTSMQIFACMMRRELVKLGIDVELITPRPVFGRIKQSPAGFGKWLGYIDRYLLFPWRLRAVAAKADVVHMCDHGSAVYAFRIKNKPVVVTCHDMLAVRGALGEITDCPASVFGRLLQLWIRRGLSRSSRVACVSQYTYEDARRVLKSDHNLRVVLNALNYPFKALSMTEIERRLAGLHGIQNPFILHVGSNETRKNREGTLRIFAMVPAEMNLQLVFAGAPLSEPLIRLADELGIRDRIVQVVRPDVEVIETLYNCATALLFPSRYEGFGWPSIEAQACGCPVVASQIPPLVEVLGTSAVVKSIADEAGMAEAIVKLATDSEYRSLMRQLGFDNVRSRFETSRMISEYMALYREVTGMH